MPRKLQLLYLPFKLLIAKDIDKNERHQKSNPSDSGGDDVQIITNEELINPFNP